MFQVRKKGQPAFEDLLREMEAIEQQLLPENSALAMNMMVLEARIRERFQKLERVTSLSLFEETTPQETLDDLQALIPQELPLMPDLELINARRKRKHTFETVGMAALLAVASAVGVFGMASLLQIALGWLA